MSKEAGSRESRQVTCRGLVIQVKGAGYDMDDRYDTMVRDVLASLRSHRRREKASASDERMLNLAKGKNVYKGYDREKITDAADIRTLKTFLRLFGAIDDEGGVTRRGTELEKGGIKPFLRKYIPRVKIISPQSSRKTKFQKGHSQAAYGAYRLRLYLMILYAASVGLRAGNGNRKA